MYHLNNLNFTRCLWCTLWDTLVHFLTNRETNFPEVLCDSVCSLVLCNVCKEFIA